MKCAGLVASKRTQHWMKWKRTIHFCATNVDGFRSSGFPCLHYCCIDRHGYCRRCTCIIFTFSPLFFARHCRHRFYTCVFPNVASFYRFFLSIIFIIIIICDFYWLFLCIFVICSTDKSQQTTQIDDTSLAVFFF